MKNIIVFGASGGTGKEVVKRLLGSGFNVTAILRNPEAFTLQHPKLTPVKGDVLRPETFTDKFEQQDAIISCLGVRSREPTEIYSKGMDNIIREMYLNNISRLVCLSAIAVVIPPKASWGMKWFIKNILQKQLKYIYNDMLKMESLISHTQFNWTIIRPPWLRNSRFTGQYRTSIEEPIDHPGKISRSDLADFIVNHLNDPATFQKKVEISY